MTSALFGGSKKKDAIKKDLKQAFTDQSDVLADLMEKCATYDREVSFLKGRLDDAQEILEERDQAISQLKQSFSIAAANAGACSSEADSNALRKQVEVLQKRLSETAEATKEEMKVMTVKMERQVRSLDREKNESEERFQEALRQSEAKLKQAHDGIQKNAEVVDDGSKIKMESLNLEKISLLEEVNKLKEEMRTVTEEQELLSEMMESKKNELETNQEELEKLRQSLLDHSIDSDKKLKALASEKDAIMQELRDNEAAESSLVASRDVQIAELLQQNATLSQEKSSLQEKVHASVEEIIQGQSGEAQALKTANAALEERVKHLEAMAQQREEELSDLMVDNKEKSSALKEALVGIQDAELNSSRTEREAGELRVLLEAVTKEKQASEERLLEKEETLYRLEHSQQEEGDVRHKELETLVDDSKNMCNKFKEECDILKREYESLEERIEKQEKERTTDTTYITQLESSQSAIEKENKALADQVNGLRYEHTEALAKASEGSACLMATIDKDLGRLRSDAVKWQMLAESLEKEKLEALDEIADVLVDFIDDDDSLLDSSKAAIEGNVMKHQLRELTTAVARRVYAVEKLRDELEQVNTLLVEKTTALEAARCVLEDQVQRLHDVLEENAIAKRDSEAEMRSLKSSLDNKQEECRTLKDAVELSRKSETDRGVSLQQQVSDLRQAEVEAMRENDVEKEKQIESSKQNETALNEQVEELLSLLQDSRKQCRQLEHELNEVKYLDDESSAELNARLMKTCENLNQAESAKKQSEADLQKLVIELEEQETIAMKKHEDMELKLAATEEALEASRSEALDYQNALKIADHQNAMDTDGLSTALLAKDEQIRQAYKTLDETQAAFKSESDQLARLQVDLQVTADERNSLRAEVVEVGDAASRLETERHCLLRAKDMLESRLTNHQEAVDDATMYRSQLRETTNSLAQAETFANAAEERYEQLAKTHSKTRRQTLKSLSSLQRKCYELSKQVGASKREVATQLERTKEELTMQIRRSIIEEFCRSKGKVVRDRAVVLGGTTHNSNHKSPSNSTIDFADAMRQTEAQVRDMLASVTNELPLETALDRIQSQLGAIFNNADPLHNTTNVRTICGNNTYSPQSVSARELRAKLKQLRTRVDRNVEEAKEWFGSQYLASAESPLSGSDVPPRAFSETGSRLSGPRRPSSASSTKSSVVFTRPRFSLRHDEVY